MKRMAFWLSFVLVTGLGTISSYAQSIGLLFPADGQVVAFQDLTANGRGMQWSAPDGTTGFQVTIRALDSLVQRDIVLDAPGSPFYLNPTIQSAFITGTNFEWSVTGTAADGSTISSPIGRFNTSTSDLRPSPTPLTPSAPPSGDANRSAQIDSPDIFIMASNWNRTFTGDLSNDLNQDGTINQLDILAYAKRYGQTAIPPTPTPVVGLPQNVRFVPNDVISFAEIGAFRIQWDPPLFPAEDLYYEVSIVSPAPSEIYSIRFLEGTEVDPPDSLTLEGKYDVYIRAKTMDGEFGDIATAHFSVDRSRVVTPTPTPEPIQIDFNADGVADYRDSQILQAAFNTSEGDANYNAAADITGDGHIDRFDQFIFESLYEDIGIPLQKPVWVSVQHPVMEPNPALPSQCVETSDPLVEAVPPLDFTLTENCIISAELNLTKINFTLVPGATEYTLDISSEGQSLIDETVEADEFAGNFIRGSRLIPLLFQGFTTFDITINAEGFSMPSGENSDTFHVALLLKASPEG